MINNPKYVLQIMSFVVGVFGFWFPASAQLSINGPTEVNAGGQYSYTITDHSGCTKAGFDWQVIGGTLANSNCTADVMVKMGTKGIASDSTDTTKQKSFEASPQITPGGGNYDCSGENSVTWENVSTLTNEELTVINNCNERTSLSVTIVPPLQNNITISPSAQSQSCGGFATTLTASTPSGGNGTYSYQWEISTDGNTYTPISGATNSYYTPSTTGENSSVLYYEVIVTSFDYSVTSTAATLTLTAPPLSGGVIYNASQEVYFNTLPAMLNCSEANGGACIAPTYTYQWQSSPDGSTWSNITGATSQNYSPGVLNSNIIYFRREAIFGEETAYSNTAEVTTILYGGIISASSPVIGSGGAITINNVASAAGGNGTYTYQYQSSPDEITWTDLSSNTVSGVSQTLFFRRKVVSGSDSTYSNTIRVNVTPSVTTVIPNGAAASSPTASPIPMPSYPASVDASNMNYVQVRQINEPGITDTASADALTDPYEVSQITTYYDGLGRPIQQVSKESTPDEHDLISPTFYDGFGRVAQQYLPYTDGGDSGGFRTNANVAQPAFYNSQFNNTEGFYYSNTIYDGSPLNEKLEVTAPGNSWTGSGVGIRQDMRANTLNDSVQIWTIGYGEDSLPRVTGTYLPGMLMLQVTTDENENKVIVYKDMQGRVVLKKLQITDALQPGQAGWLCTYYVYDDMNHLRYVIPPAAVNWLEANNWTFSSSGGGQVGAGLCFSYLYDARGRVIMKQTPGGGKTYYVYDNRDRVVFSVCKKTT